MSKEEELHQQIDRISREREAYAQALATSNQAFMEKVKEFSIIKRLADGLQVGMNRRQICSEIVNIIIDETTAENCSLWLMGKSGSILSLYAVRGQDDLETRYLSPGEGRNLEVGKGAAGWAARNGESLLIEDVASSPYFIPSESPTPIRSLLCLPIKDSLGVIGVLNMSHPDIGEFSTENERVLQLITDQAGIGLANNQLFEEVQQLNRDLEHKVVDRTRHLKRSEERYQRAINAGKVGIWDWQVGSPEMYVAPNLMAMLGYQASDRPYRIKHWLQTIFPADRKKFVRDMVRHMNGDVSIYEGEHRLQHKSGHLLWFFVRAAAVRNDSGSLSRIYGSNTDITKRKEAELELARAQEQALINAHSAGKAEFATTVLHNIGNVLNSVNVDSLHTKKTLEGMRLPQLVMACGLLLEHKKNLVAYLTQDERGSKLPEYLSKVVEVVSRNAGSITRLADNIASKVDLMRDIIETQQSYAATSSSTRPQDLSRLVEEALKVQLDSFQKRSVILQQRFASVPQVMVNPSKLVHVVINLTKNAIESMELVLQSHRILDLEIKQDEEGNVCLIVSDNGTGITAENLSHMFEHGFTTKKQGHGFGLHYCARTVEAMGGHVSVESQGQDQGATFKLIFPPIQSEPQEEEDETEQDHPSTSEHVNAKREDLAL